MVLAGWHPGEVAVQSKLGYARAMAMEQGYTWVSDYLSPQHRMFHTRTVPFVPVTTLDDNGRPWGSIITESGSPGFIQSPEDTKLILHFEAIDGDPIVDNIVNADGGRNLIAGLGIEFPTRRRNKFAGKIASTKRRNSSVELTMDVTQALG